MILNCKKLDIFWMQLGTLSLVFLFAVSCQNHFWHPKALFFTRSNRLDIIQALINNFVTLLTVVLQFLEMSLLFSSATCSYEMFFQLLWLILVALIVFIYLFSYSQHDNISLQSPTSFISQHKYIAQILRAIIPIP